MNRALSLAAIVGCAAWGSGLPLARAAAPSVIDRAAVRFYAPETGGATYPSFIFERTLAFEARLAAMADGAATEGESYDERDVREALEHHVAEEILSRLADKLIADSAPDKRPSASDLADIEKDLANAFAEQVGGRARIDRAAQLEQIAPREIDDTLRRGALAAWYLDRAVAPIFRPTEEQLREVFRSTTHPYRGEPFEQARPMLERWFIVERVRAMERAFLQAARSRVRIIVIP